jgi:hypothetical protein
MENNRPLSLKLARLAFPRSSVHRLLAAAIALLACGGAGLSARASPIDDITVKVSQCLKTPPNGPTSYRFLVRAKLAQDGSVVLVSVGPMGHARPTAWETSAAPMISQAVYDCEPYTLPKPFNTFGIIVDQALMPHSH